MPLRNRVAAEFIGIFWLVLGGCGSAVLAEAVPIPVETEPPSAKGGAT
jgi:glycerol uptake facilitator-like aquaporin